MVNQEIRQKAISGSKWTIIEKLLLQVVQFIVGITLARVLGPGAFGLIALTSLFLTISGAIADGGFEKALIQNQSLSVIQISTAFYINILLGLIMALFVYVSAPGIALFFHALPLKNVLRVLSLGIPLDAFAQTQRMLLIKELHFKKIAVAQVCSAVISGTVGITLALSGAGVWALVSSALTSTLVGVLIFWYRSSWYPSLTFSYSSVAKMVPFGLNVMSSSILLFSLQQFNNFVVGKYYSKADLGLFNRGMKFPDMIASIIQGVVIKMSFPLFSKLQDDKEHLKYVLRKCNRIVAFIAFPLLGYMFINAKEIVIFLLTDKWIGAVVYLKIFCLVKLLEPFITIQRELLLAQGKANLLLRLFVITSLFEILPILFFVKYGIIYIVWITLASKAFQYLLYQFITANRMHIPLLESIKWITPYFVIICFIIAGVQVINFILPSSIIYHSFFKLSIDLSIGILLYSVIVARSKLEELTTLKSVLNSFIK